MSVHVITTYYNPCHYKRRRDNYDRFIEGLRKQNVPCLTIETALPDEEFELPSKLGVIQMKTEALMWHKERLLNLAANWLPDEYDIIAWIDCDVLFDDASWVKELEELMKDYPIAQLWTSADRLNSKGESIGDVVASFASKTALMDPSSIHFSQTRYDEHGHTGYAWAMRRELFEKIGLYDAAIAGSADHFMAHAIFGDCGFCIQNCLKKSKEQLTHLQSWSQEFFNLTQGKLGVLSGNIRHLWHGEAKHRRYFLRQWDLAHLRYNPWTDLIRNPGEPLSWAPTTLQNKPRLVNYFKAYFQSRREDEETT